MYHVLVVDDNKVSLASAKKVLGSSYRITAVTSGRQALKFLENNSCDVILLDINMPDMDGFQTMERIRAGFKNPPPIIFLTADDDEYTESCCLKAGALDFVTKPFAESVILSHVNRIIKLSEMKNVLEKSWRNVYSTYGIFRKIWCWVWQPWQKAAITAQADISSVQATW